jgi:GNAT superfamily N-acetyltransferase
MVEKEKPNIGVDALSFAFEPAHLVASEIAPHVARHHKEMLDSDANGAVNVDWESYIQGGLAGSCMIVTARHGGKLVGYSIYQIGRNSRQKHIMEAYGDGLFIEKEFRGFGRQFLEKADEFLKEYGVHQTHYALESARLGRWMAKAGYQSKTRIWSKQYE